MPVTRTLPFTSFVLEACNLSIFPCEINPPLYLSKDLCTYIAHGITVPRSSCALLPENVSLRAYRALHKLVSRGKRCKAWRDTRTTSSALTSTILRPTCWCVQLWAGAAFAERGTGMSAFDQCSCSTISRHHTSRIWLSMMDGAWENTSQHWHSCSSSGSDTYNKKTRQNFLAIVCTDMVLVLRMKASWIPLSTIIVGRRRIPPPVSVRYSHKTNPRATAQKANTSASLTRNESTGLSFRYT